MKITTRHENWPLRDSFSISRGSKTSVDVIVAEIEDAGKSGIGECVPYPRYGETIKQTLLDISSMGNSHASELKRDSLRDHFPANAARNAVDCALWHLESRQSGKEVWEIAHLPPPKPVLGACSLSLENPYKLAQSAEAQSNFPLLKIKLGDDLVIESVRVVRDACPSNRMIVDANEAWTADSLTRYLPKLAKLGVEMIEQPLPASDDEFLENFDSEIPLCADESFHLGSDLERLINRYEVFNIKLDKSGGLTEAISLAQQIHSVGKKIMIGSMMATSYSLSPALLLAHYASYVDLDSSIWLLEDHPNGVKFIDGVLYPADRSFWG